MEEDSEDAVLDAGLIGAAQGVEHNEIAPRTEPSANSPKVLGETEHESPLEETL
jgi:ferritin-like metal-binding protein YciE